MEKKVSDEFRKKADDCARVVFGIYDSDDEERHLRGVLDVLAHALADAHNPKNSRLRKGILNLMADKIESLKDIDSKTELSEREPYEQPKAERGTLVSDRFRAFFDENEKRIGDVCQGRQIKSIGLTEKQEYDRIEYVCNVVFDDDEVAIIKCGFSRFRDCPATCDKILKFKMYN